MMQILVGVDREPGPVVPLLKRLNFPYARYEVVHTLSAADYLSYGIEGARTPEEVEKIVGAENRLARQLAESGARLLARDGEPHPVGDVLFGHPTEALLRRAESLRAELVAINASHAHSEGVAALTGSVARGVAMGSHQSILIARHSLLFHADDQPVRAVFATDHSEYANRCLEQLIDFAPRGLSHLLVMTAVPERELELVDRELPELGISVSASVRQALERRNQSVAHQLDRELKHTQVEATLSTLPIHEAIDRALDQASADLLIVGAKGHSLLERLSLGSVSLHQAISGPSSVLILRAQSS
jgi:nucleotide-binding universal stress UspA family protein